MASLPKVDEIGRLLKWHEDDLIPGLMIVVQRHGKYHFAEVREVEKKRNCRMLHIYVHESHEFEWGCWNKKLDWKLNPFESFKKVKGSEVFEWLTTKSPKYAPSAPEQLERNLKRAAEKKRRKEAAKRAAEKLKEERRVKAEKRKVYREQRSLLVKQRTSMNEAFSLVGLSRNASPEEFKKVFRSLMLKWHPDKVAMRSDSISESEFMSESKKVTSALAEVRTYLSVVWESKTV